MISRILGKIKGEYVFSAEENQYISCVNIFKKHELWPYREKAKYLRRNALKKGWRSKGHRFVGYRAFYADTEDASEPW